MYRIQELHLSKWVNMPASRFRTKTSALEALKELLDNLPENYNRDDFRIVKMSNN